MKKFIFGAFTLLMLVSCHKADERVETKQKVVFAYQIATEVPMTKTINNDNLIDWIAEQLPTSVSIRLTDANGTKYNITTGSEVELPVGIYTVTGKDTPQASANVVGSNAFFTSRPSLSINTSVEVTYTQKQYVIPATYTAFGIVVDRTETASASYVSSHGETGNVPFTEVDNAGIVFVSGNLDTYSLDITLSPISSGDAETTYTFKTAYSTSSISPTFGNYYIIHPKGISSVEGGAFTYSIGSFRAVDVEE